MRICDTSRGVFESKHTTCLLDEASPGVEASGQVHLLLLNWTASNTLHVSWA